MAVEIERFGGAVRRMRENSVAYQPAIDEKELVAPASETDAARDVARRARSVVRLIDFRQVRLGIAAENLHDAVTQREGGREVEGQPAVVLQTKRARRQ